MLLTTTSLLTVMNLETLKYQTKPYFMLNFDNEAGVASCKVMSDQSMGGFSRASLDYVPADPSKHEPAHARFHGNISTKLPANWRVERSGMFRAFFFFFFFYLYCV